MATDAYACDECLDTGTVKISHGGDKMWVDCSHCDAPTLRRSEAMERARAERAAELRAEYDRAIGEAVAEGVLAAVASCLAAEPTTDLGEKRHG